MPPVKTIKSIVSELASLNQAEVINVTDRESSMLQGYLRDKALNEIYPALVRKYQAKYQEMGGAEQILLDLEQYIAQQINELAAARTSAAPANAGTLWKKMLNPKEWLQSIMSNFVSMGALAQRFPRYRSEIAGNLGVYHTALRALSDSNTLSWQSLLHKGSHESCFGIRLREMLAYYWLAASDTEMEFIDTIAEDAVTNQQRQELLTASKGNFIEVVSEIRRAHNEGEIQFASLDNPSCGPGTAGRIIINAAKYNKVAQLPIIPCTKIPAEVESYIVEQIRKAPATVKNAIYEYLFNTLMCDDVDDNSKDTALKFLDSLMNQQAPLIDFVKEKIPELMASSRGNAIVPQNNGIMGFEQVNRILTTLLQQATGEATPEQEAKNKKIAEGIVEIFKILLGSLKFDNNAEARNDFIKRVLIISAEGKQEQELIQRLSSDALELRLNLFKVHNQLKVIDYLINNETIRGHLVPAYATSNKAQEKMIYFRKKLAAYNQQIARLQELARKQIDEKTRQYEQEAMVEAADGGVSFANASVSAAIRKNAIESVIPASTQKRFDEINRLNDSIRLKLGSSKSSLAQIAHLLPKAPSQKMPLNQYGVDEQWALHILRIAFEKEASGQLTRDEDEIRRTFELLCTRTDAEQQAAVIELVGSKLADLVDEKNKGEVAQFIEVCLAKGANQHVERFRNAYHTKTLSDQEKMQLKIEQQFAAAGLDGQQQLRLLAVQIFRNEAFNQQDYEDWKKLIIGLAEKDLAENFELIKNIVLQTFMNNLGLASLRADDIYHIESLLIVYLKAQSIDGIVLQALPFPVDTALSIADKVKSLSGHLSCLLTSLKPLSNEFKAGTIQLMSRQKAAQLVMDCDVAGAYIVNVSRVYPNELYLYYRRADDRKEQAVKFAAAANQKVIEDKAFSFPAVVEMASGLDAEVLRMGNRRNIALTTSVARAAKDQNSVSAKPEKDGPVEYLKVNALDRRDLARAMQVEMYGNVEMKFASAFVAGRQENKNPLLDLFKRQGFALNLNILSPEVSINFQAHVNDEAKLAQVTRRLQWLEELYKEILLTYYTNKLIQPVSVIFDTQRSQEESQAQRDTLILQLQVLYRNLVRQLKEANLALPGIHRAKLYDVVKPKAADSKNVKLIDFRVKTEHQTLEPFTPIRREVTNYLATIEGKAMEIMFNQAAQDVESRQSLSL